MFARTVRLCGRRRAFVKGMRKLKSMTSKHGKITCCKISLCFYFHLIGCRKGELLKKWENHAYTGYFCLYSFMFYGCTYFISTMSYTIFLFSTQFPNRSTYIYKADYIFLYFFFFDYFLCISLNFEAYNYEFLARNQLVIC